MPCKAVLTLPRRARARAWAPHPDKPVTRAAPDPWPDGQEGVDWLTAAALENVLAHRGSDLPHAEQATAMPAEEPPSARGKGVDRVARVRRIGLGGGPQRVLYPASITVQHVYLTAREPCAHPARAFGEDSDIAGPLEEEPFLFERIDDLDREKREALRSFALIEARNGAGSRRGRAHGQQSRLHGLAGDEGVLGPQGLSQQ